MFLGTLCVGRPDGPRTYMYGTGLRSILFGLFFACFFASLPAVSHLDGPIFRLWNARLSVSAVECLFRESLSLLLCASDGLEE